MNKENSLAIRTLPPAYPHDGPSRRDFLKLAGATGASAFFLDISKNTWADSPDTRKPNIIYILADDLGYGDVGCLNPQSKIPTPNIDRLAREGTAFTDAHSGSAVCTPTRYGILTGRYCWRSTLKAGVLEGYSPALINRDRMTVASLLKAHGYRTACVGKWHLGWDWPTRDEKPAREENTDYKKPIENGPLQLGFDYFFGIPASLDMPPYVYIENDRAIEAPTEQVPSNGKPAYFRGGPAAPGFHHAEVLPALTRKAVECLERHAAEHSQEPLFLYFPLTAPHTPIMPAKEFEGKSGIGPYGDFVCQVDNVIGQVTEALDRNGMAENTLIMVTSDNGCSPMADFEALRALGHDPSYHFRGHKADIFEGGHRIPFVARWPGKIKPGARCANTTCLTDLLATAAEILGVSLPDNAGEDSVSMLPVLLDPGTPPAREATVHHSINGSFSIRQGRWKLEFCAGSGGWSYPKPGEAEKLGLPPIQLYDVNDDTGEKTNVCAQHPDVVERLTALMEKYILEGRSTPGAPQKNEGQDQVLPRISH